MSIFADSASLLPGLKPAAWRGIPFFMPDASVEIGRRIVSTYFPGRDGRAVEDLGRDDGPVRVNGIIVGDDYVSKALALQAALQQRGPGTLLHPWLGEMTVVVPEGSGLIHFSAAQLRVIRFEVAFMPVPAGLTGLIGSTLSGLLSSVSSLLGAAQSLCASVLGITMAVSTWVGAVTAATSIGALVRAAVSGSSAYAVVGDAVSLALTSLTAAATGAGGTSDAAILAASLAPLVAPVADAALADAPSAIGSGGSSTIAAPQLTARAGATLLLDIATQIRALDVTGVPAAAVRLAAAAIALARAVEVAAEIDYQSRQDAEAWRADLFAAIDGTESLGIALAVEVPAPVAVLLSALDGMRAALALDLSETIGRLPSVQLVTPADTVSAWLIAQHFAGDNPSAVVATFRDIVTRNRLRHAGAVAPEPVEVLV